MSTRGYIIVEGRNDFHFLKHFLSARGAHIENTTTDQAAVDSAILTFKGNDDRVVAAITPAIKGGGSVAIIIDADSDVRSRWMQIRHQLKLESIAVPEEPVTSGFVGSGLLPEAKVGVWIMPDNISGGALEDFLGTLISPDDLCWPYAKEVTQNSKSLGAIYRSAHLAKAQLNTWLAWQDPPGRAYGVTVQAGLFRSHAPSADVFVHWLYPDLP